MTPAVSCLRGLSFIFVNVFDLTSRDVTLMVAESKWSGIAGLPLGVVMRGGEVLS